MTTNFHVCEEIACRGGSHCCLRCSSQQPVHAESLHRTAGQVASDPSQCIQVQCAEMVQIQDSDCFAKSRHPWSIRRFFACCLLKQCMSMAGRSAIVGLPVTLMLMHRNATVTNCNVNTPLDVMRRECQQVGHRGGILRFACSSRLAGGYRNFGNGQTAVRQR